MACFLLNLSSKANVWSKKKISIFRERRCWLTTGLKWAHGAEQFYLLSFRVSPKGMAAHKTKVAAVIDKSSNQIPMCSKDDIECITLISFTLHMPIPFPPQSSPQKSTQVSPVPAHSLCYFQEGLGEMHKPSPCLCHQLLTNPTEAACLTGDSGPSNQISPRKEMKWKLDIRRLIGHPIARFVLCKHWMQVTLSRKRWTQTLKLLPLASDSAYNSPQPNPPNRTHKPLLNRKGSASK